MALEPELTGLTAREVLDSRTRFGTNKLYIRPRRALIHLLWSVATEPVFFILVLASGLYFAIGDINEAFLMLVSIAFVIGIEIFQEYRSERALNALVHLSQPKARVLRDGESVFIPVEDVVVGDLLAFAEGERIAADADIFRHNDLSIEEAVLTGESLPAVKSARQNENKAYQGTVVATGSGIARVCAVGAQTEFGKLGKSLESIQSEPTPLQKQINRFVRQMGAAGITAFLIVLAINYYYAGTFLAALLFSLAFAMALIPEEIPVAFSAFMALGAARMTRQKILVKQPKTVESLGSATVICLDKTGTITENRMSVAEVIDFSGRNCVLEYAMWASEPEPFDAMEKAIHAAYAETAQTDLRPAHTFFHEYPLEGTPPMMTHIHRNREGRLVVAAKGAVERILQVCRADAGMQESVLARTHRLAAMGYRVLGVSSADHHFGEFPEAQENFDWNFEGLVALFDPPKANIKKVIEKFYEAGVSVKMVTGDYPETARNIARASGLRIEGPVIDGTAVVNMAEEDLRLAVRNSSIFARVFPAAKLRIVEALKANGEVVAMTGDGVNDGPALKAAQIGVAMGQRGTEIAKGAASLVLLDDDLAHMVTAIETGRRIYSNLRKAIRYIISVHIPIVLLVLLPLVFGWTYLHLLGPVHVIFLELIMDPTCAVVFENEPAEPGSMQRGPRNTGGSLFSWKELSFSVVQGLVITAGLVFVYYYALSLGSDEPGTRAYVFTTLLLSNIFLTLVNRSFDHTIATTLRYRNQLMWIIIAVTFGLLALILCVPQVSGLFKIAPIGWEGICMCAVTALVSVGWVELWKLTIPSHRRARSLSKKDPHAGRLA